VQKASQQFVTYFQYVIVALSFLFVAAILSVAVAAAAPKAKAKPTPNPRYAAIVIDANNGKTLYQENANARRFPASLTKMMTLYMLFEAMQLGRMAPETPIPVSAYAAARPPTKIGFKPGQTIAVQDAAKALITRSANDVASAVAEYLGGSEARFARNMTKKAHQLGMMNTNFANASGLPDNNNYSTARDMAILSLALREHFPQYYHLFNITGFSYKGQTINSHNRLVRNMKGVDGIKTGFIRASGFNVATSMRSEGKSLVAVVMGGRTAASRDEHMKSLLNRYISKASKKKKTAPLVAKAPPVNGSDDFKQVAQIVLPEGRQAPVPMVKADILLAGREVTQQELAIETLIEPNDELMAFAPMIQKPVTSAREELEQVIAQSEIEVMKEEAEAEIIMAALPPVVLDPSLEQHHKMENGHTSENMNDREHDALLLAALAREYPGSEPAILAFNPLLEAKDTPPATEQSPSEETVAMAELREEEAEQEIDIFTTASISNGKKGWVIQIATAKTVREADIALYKALNAAGERLEKAEPYLQLHDTGEARYYRARFSGFKSQKSALNSCVALQSKAIDCFVFED